MRSTVLGAVMVLLAVAGCGADPSAEVAAVATAFLAETPAQACGLLAPETAKALRRSDPDGCVHALASVSRRAGGEVLSVEVAGESAQVRFADQTAFLSRFPEGWRVIAAGCVKDDPDPATPYECAVQP